MFAFLIFFDRYVQYISAERVIEDLRKLSDTGAARADINRAYWKVYRGLDREVVRAAASQWVTQRRKEDPDFFIETVVEKLRAHKRSGHRIALVSGSGLEILEPISAILEADYILATRLYLNGGLYTGEIIPPTMIGQGKANAAICLCGELGSPTASCFAYGDHISDLPLLELVGNPVCVGGRGDLADHARQRGWPVMCDRIGQPEGEAK